MKHDPVEAAWNEIVELRTMRDPAPRLAVLLQSKSNLVVGKVARAAGDLRLVELTPQLTAAFHRVMVNPSKLDKGCMASTAIVHALYALDYELADVYSKGVHHIQLEASFGPPVDVAAPLRSASAMGLMRTRHPDALFQVESLLFDAEPMVRAGAARAIATHPGETSELLLRLKVLAGDAEPEVLAECFAGLLQVGSVRSLQFVGSYLDGPDEGVAEAAVLSLGASRAPEALQLLIGKWRRTSQRPMRKVLLLAFAAARQEPAFDFLIDLLAHETASVAGEVYATLQVCRHDNRIMQRVEEALAQRDDRDEIRRS